MDLRDPALEADPAPPDAADPAASLQEPRMQEVLLQEVRLQEVRLQEVRVQEVRVQAPGRLHLGFLDPGGTLGRRFGSLGLVIDGPVTDLTLRIAARDRIDPAGAPAEGERLRQHLQQLRRLTGWMQPLQLRLRQALPAHCGLGSGTQLALAVGTAFARLAGLRWSAAQVAAALGRGQRSGVGIAGFEHGGFLLDGGPGDGPAPLLARFDLPAGWRIVLVNDPRCAGLHGAAEVAALAALPPFPREAAAALCHQVLMGLLPALAEQRFAPFAAAVTALQARLGAHFAPAQQGRVHSSVAVDRAMRWAAGWCAAQQVPAGLGQSSWGPLSFILLPDAAAAARLRAALAQAGAADAALTLQTVAACNHGARIDGVF